MIASLEQLLAETDPLVGPDWAEWDRVTRHVLADHLEDDGWCDKAALVRVARPLAFAGYIPAPFSLWQISCWAALDCELTVRRDGGVLLHRVLLMGGTYYSYNTPPGQTLDSGGGAFRLMVNADAGDADAPCRVGAFGYVIREADSEEHVFELLPEVAARRKLRRDIITLVRRLA